MHYPQKDERLLSKGTVAPCQWGSEILEFGLIFIMKRFHDSH